MLGALSTQKDRTMAQTISVVVPVYGGVTQLDFTGPHQFLSRTPDVQVRVASLDGRPVTADRLTFSNLEDLGAIAACDVLLVPGGGGCLNAIENDRFLEEIARLGATARYLTSVCTGSLILGAAGFLRGRRAACHWAWRELLPLFGAIVDEGRVVRDGNILSGGGVTAGIDFVLALIAELRGPRVAEMVQLGLEYAPQPPFDSGRPDTAPAEVLEAVNARRAAGRAERRVRFDAWAAAHRAVQAA
jgi:putative intracellular protease/amidase